jgi:hypothetical protein
LSSLAIAVWTVVTFAAASFWEYQKHTVERQNEIKRFEQVKAREFQERIDAERNAELTRRIEAQKPFLEKKLNLFFDTIQVAARLTEWQLDPKSPKWQESARRFWELRWGELEMVGDPGIRDAARRVGQQLVEVEHNPDRDRHDLRWMVECLADELRFALEHAWGIDRNAKRATSIGPTAEVSKLPSGCNEGPRPPTLFSGMQKLEALGNSQYRRN